MPAQNTQFSYVTFLEAQQALALRLADTGMVFTDPGVHIRADYGPLGRVEVSFPR